MHASEGQLPASSGDSLFVRKVIASTWFCRPGSSNRSMARWTVSEAGSSLPCLAKVRDTAVPVGLRESFPHHRNRSKSMSLHPDLRAEVQQQRIPLPIWVSAGPIIESIAGRAARVHLRAVSSLTGGTHIERERNLRVQVVEHAMIRYSPRVAAYDSADRCLNSRAS